MRLRGTTTRPYDLAAVVGLSLLGVLAVGIVGMPPWLRVPFGLALVVILPGYALTASLFPGATNPGNTAAVQWSDGGLATAARIALSLGLSLSLVVLLGLGMSYTPLGVRTTPMAVGLVALTILFSAIAFVRRSRRRPEERLSLAIDLDLSLRGSPVDRVLSFALAVAILLAVAATAYAFSNPRSPEPFTEVYLLDAEGTVDCLPASFRNGYATAPRAACQFPPGNVTLGLANHEGRRQSYWVRMVWTNETTTGPGNSTNVLSVQEIRRWSVTLDDDAVDPAPGTSHRAQYEVPIELPPPPGPGLWRLSFQVYREDPPAVAPTPGFLEGPYRRVHLWIAAA